MFPIIRLFDEEFFLYNILVNMGTVVGLAVMLILLYKYKYLNKRLIIAFAVSMGISLPFARILRGFMESENIEEFMCTEGSHFIGMVMAFYFIFPMICKYAVKININDDIKAISAVYFCIQHFFSRLGCYSFGCCFGKPYEGIFGITFPYGTNPYMIYGEEISIFPTQLFESFSMAALLVLLVIFAVKKRKYVYSVFIFGFSTVIFVSEIFMYKYDYERLLSIFSLPQICAMILIICETIKIIKQVRKENYKVMK